MGGAAARKGGRETAFQGAPHHQWFEEYVSSSPGSPAAEPYKLFARVFENPGPLEPPRLFKLAAGIRGVHRALGHAVGVGIRPEHVGNGRRSTNRKRAATAFLIGAALGTAALLAERRRRVLARG